MAELRAFLAVVSEGGFSKAAARLQRTQSAVSYAVRRLEKKLGEPLFDRSSNNGLLTEAGELLQTYAERLIRLSTDAQTSLRELRELRRGRVLIGANEAAIPVMMPIIGTFRDQHAGVLVEIRRVHARDLPSELVQGNLDFGVSTFVTNEARLGVLTLGRDEMVAVLYPEHPLAKRSTLSIGEWAKEPIIVHNESTVARERVMRLAESSGASVNVQMALPTLDAIKLAVTMKLGISMMPRRCVMMELERGQLVAVPVPDVRRPHPVRLLYRRTSQRSRAATAFLRIATEGAPSA